MTIKERREQLGLQQKELLALIRQDEPRMDIGSLSRIENGFLLPASEEVLASLERHLQTSRSDLFSGVEIFAIEMAEFPREANTDLLASVLKYGHKNAIKREELCEILGVSDRKMRKMVERAKRDGLAVCNDGDDDGYYIADTPEEYDRQYQRIYHRAMSMMVQLKHYQANRGLR